MNDMTLHDYELHTRAIYALIEHYFEGLYRADSQVLRPIFHVDARYVNTNTDDYMNFDMETYFAVIDKRVPPADQAATRKERVLSVDFASDTLAFVRLTMCMFEREYDDFLTLINHKGQWQIISKVFSYTHLN